MKFYFVIFDISIWCLDHYTPIKNIKHALKLGEWKPATTLKNGAKPKSHRSRKLKTVKDAKVRN